MQNEFEPVHRRWRSNAFHLENINDSLLDLLLIQVNEEENGLWNVFKKK